MSVSKALVALLLLTLMAVPATAAEWQPNTFYSVGALVTYQGPTYSCRQAHTSQLGWEPPNAAALWQLESNPTPTPTRTSTPTSPGSPTPTWTPTATTPQGSATPTLSPPQGVSATNGVATCSSATGPIVVTTPIRISWNVVGGLTYTVKHASNGNAVLASGLTSSPYEIWNMSISGSFVMSSRIGTSGAESANSAAVFATWAVPTCAPPPSPTPTATGTPPAPTGLTATTGNWGCQGSSPQLAPVRLQWSPVSSVMFYNVKKSASAGGPFTTIASAVTSTSHNVYPSGNSCTANATTTQCYFAVSAVRSMAGEGPNSAAIVGQWSIPACPTGTPAPAPKTDCRSTSDCGGGSLQCAMFPPGGMCTGCSDSAVACKSGTSCSGSYIGFHSVCLRVCSTDADCNSGMVCSNSRCLVRSCTSDAQCPSPYRCNTTTSRCERSLCSSGCPSGLVCRAGDTYCTEQ